MKHGFRPRRTSAISTWRPKIRGPQYWRRYWRRAERLGLVYIPEVGEFEKIPFPPVEWAEQRPAGPLEKFLGPCRAWTPDMVGPNYWRSGPKTSDPQAFRDLVKLLPHAGPSPAAQT